MKVTVNKKEYDLDDINITGNASEERETNINISADDKYASIYTSDNVYLTKFKKNIMANPKEWKITDIYYIRESICGVRLRAPKSLMSFRSKTMTRELTDEQREVMRTRLKKIKTKE